MRSGTILIGSKNSIRSVDHIKHVIKLNDYQEQEIRRVVDEPGTTR